MASRLFGDDVSLGYVRRLHVSSSTEQLDCEKIDQNGQFSHLRAKYLILLDFYGMQHSCCICSVG